MRNLFDVNYTPYMVRDSKGIDEKDWFNIDWDKLPLIVSPRNEEYKFKDAIKICSRFNRDVITPGVLDEVEEYVYNGTDTDTAARFVAIDTGEILDWITMSRAKFGNDFDWETMEDALSHLNKFLTDLRQYAPTAPGVDLVAVSDRAEDDEKSRADLSGELSRLRDEVEIWKRQAFKEAAANADKMESLRIANKTLRATNKTLRMEVEALERMLEEAAALSERNDTDHADTTTSTHAAAPSGEYTADDVWKRYVMENGLRDDMRD